MDCSRTFRLERSGVAPMPNSVKLSWDGALATPGCVAKMSYFPASFANGCHVVVKFPLASVIAEMMRSVSRSIMCTFTRVPGTPRPNWFVARPESGISLPATAVVIGVSTQAL